MVYYKFNKPKQEDNELKTKDSYVSNWKFLCIVAVTIFQTLSIFYDQYKVLYYDNVTDIKYLLTMAVSLLAGLTTTVFNARISFLHRDKHTQTIVAILSFYLSINFILTHYSNKTFINQICTHIVSAMFLCLQLPNFMRYICVLKYSIKCKFGKTDEKMKYYKQMVDGEAEAGLIGLLDCYLKSVFQEIIQVMVVFSANLDILQFSVEDQLSILCSFILLPWTSTSYHESLRKQNDDHFPFSNMVVYLIWNIFLVAARIISISAAVSVCPVGIIIIILIHWLVATCYLYYQHEPFDFYKKSKLIHAPFCGVFGIVYLFVPINLDNEPKFFVYKYFYLITFIENCIFLSLWLFLGQILDFYTKSIFCVFVITVFLIGITLMILYYAYLHQQTTRTDKNPELLTDDDDAQDL